MPKNDFVLPVVDYPEFHEKLVALEKMKENFLSTASKIKKSTIQRVIDNLQMDDRARPFIDPTGQGEFLAVALFSKDQQFLDEAREHLRRLSMAGSAFTKDTLERMQRADRLPENILTEKTAEAYADAYVKEWEKAIKAIAKDMLDTSPRQQRIAAERETLEMFQEALNVPTMSGKEGRVMQKLIDASQRKIDKLVKRDAEDPLFTKRVDARKAIKKDIGLE